VGLDHLLMEAVSGEVAIMANGCVCCTFRGDLADTLRDLLARRDAGTVPDFARVLVETTGLADPAPIAQMLLNNPLVSHFARLDAIVTTVDAANAPRQLAEHPQAVKQVALADRLLLTKVDLAAPGPLTDRLRALNPAAPLIPVRDGQVAPDRLFGAALFDPARGTEDPRGWLNEPAYHDHDHNHAHHDHGDGVAAFCLAFDRPLDWSAASHWLAQLRQWRGADLLRVKGILCLTDEPVPVAVHGVHHIFHPPVRLAAWPNQSH
jgi:G3E family GTPase